jgi:hypothetical protein
MPSDYRSATPIPKTVAGASLAEVDAFLQLLARAVRQFHTYPPTSPMCTESVAACHKAFAALDCADWLVLRVTPHEFIYDEAGIGAGTLVEHELVRRLHRAHVAALHFDRSASLRDFTRLCADIIRGADLPSTETTFAELLADHGVETIVPRMAHRPEVLQVGARPAAAWDLVEHEVSRRRAATPVGPVQYLYPPEKGWVRLDPETSVDSVSLVDLAVLVDDPAQIATMLLRLTDDDPSGGRAPEQALEQKFSDVAMLFAALDGHLARLMFDKLARAVLALRPERRRDLLQRTILPGLLDGRADGAVLRDFPDPDLADSLCLLLDLETAAPEVVTAAMNRLDLPEDRRQSVAALVETRLQAGSGARDGEPEHGTERYARRLIRIDAAQSRTFAEFSAFDLAMDDTATVTVAEVCRAIGSTDGLSEQVDCLWRLTSIEPNPALVEGFMRRALALTAQLDRAGRWADLAAIVLRFRQTAETLKETRPDVRDAVMTGLGSFCSRGRMSALLDLHERAGVRGLRRSHRPGMPRGDRGARVGGEGDGAHGDHVQVRPRAGGAAGLRAGSVSPRGCSRHRAGPGTRGSGLRDGRGRPAGPPRRPDGAGSASGARAHRHGESRVAGGVSDS